MLVVLVVITGHPVPTDPLYVIDAKSPEPEAHVDAFIVEYA